MSRFEDIRQWAADRNLIEGSTPDKQFLKLVAEVGEIAAGMARGKVADTADGVGDVVVVLTVLCAQMGFEIESCIELAWQEIKDRKGQMVDGVFIKEQEGV